MQVDTVDIQIGKLGLSQEIIREIKSHLKKKKNVKLKFLKSFIQDRDRKEVAKEVEEKIRKGKLIGNTYTIKNG